LGEAADGQEGKLEQMGDPDSIPRDKNTKMKMKIGG